MGNVSSRPPSATCSSFRPLGGFPRPLTGTGNVSQPAIWSPDSTALLIQRAGVLELVSLDGPPDEKPRVPHRGALYHPRLGPGDAPYASPRWSPDGTSLLVATREAPETTLLLLSADGRLKRSLLTVEGVILSWDWSPDGQSVVVVTQSEDAHVGDVQLVDVASGTARVLWQEAAYMYGKPVAGFVPQAAADGAKPRLLFRSNRSGWAKLYIADLSESGADDVRPLTSGEWDDYSFRISPDGLNVIYSSRAAQAGTGDDLWRIPLAGGEPERLTVHAGVNYPISCGADGTVFYWHADPTEPGDLWSLSPSARIVTASGSWASAAVPVSLADTPKRLTWTVSSDAQRKLRPPEEVTVHAPDGTAVSALVYLPAYHQEGQQHPPIVWIRGGPTGFSRYTFSAQPAWLANEGFLVITPNYRGSTGHGVPFMEAVAGDGVGKHDLADVLATADFAKTLPEADLTRGIGIGGVSWGGYLTLMAVTNAPETFSCAVAGAAIADWSIQQAETEVR